ncbi:endonuclease III [Patescibacteria group bacterium]|nr:endonuclease III [Patescibacteria group bacterium]MBU2508975.1 endonuclease III [Patescibacteria group bacterium]
MKNVTKVIKTLQKHYTKKGDMDLGSAEKTLIGTLLSARTTDVQVLKVFPGFRKKFPNFRALAKARISNIEKSVNSIGLYKSKAKALKGLAQIIVRDHKGKVPKEMEDLIKLPGVGRKTANCLRYYAFGIPGVCVDTHVFRITHRLGWTRSKTPEKVEQDIMKIAPDKLWGEINRTMVHFGRDICKPRKPECWRCPISKWCEFKPKTRNTKQ